MADSDFAELIVPVAKHFWGDHNPKLSSKTEMRWGSQGSRAVFLDGPGNWQNFESGEKGGVIDLVKCEQHTDKQGALQWLQANGYLSATDKPQERENQNSAPTPPFDEDIQPQEGDGGVLKNVAGYTYTDADGNNLYQVVRKQWLLPDGTYRLGKDGQIAKTFRQRRKLPNGKEVWNLDGVTHTIYRHPQVEIAIEAGKPIVLPEGEKDADTAVKLGFEGSTNSGGAKNWTPALALLFKGADVVIPVDNDETGIAAGEAKAKSLKGIAKRIRVLNFAEHVPNFPAKHDLTNWVEAGGCAEELQRIVDSLPDWTPSPPVSKFGAKTSRNIAKALVAYDWLVKHLIERNGILIIAGESQAGKSFLVMDMGMKIARGIDYAGHKVKQGAVIHMAVEDGKGTDLRHKGYRKANGISPDEELPYVIMDPFANNGIGFSLMNDEQVDKFIVECLEWKAYYGSLEFIIIDTLSMATEGMDENSSGEASKVLGRVNRIRERTGATVCIVHHMNSGGTKVRGSTAIVANVPNVIELKPMMTFPQNRREEPKPILDGDKRPIRRARLAKNKNGAANISWKMVLNLVQLDEVDEDGDHFETMVCTSPSQRDYDYQPKSKISSEDQRLVLEALKDALSDHGQEMPTGVRVGPQVQRCVAQKDFVAYVRRRMQFKAPEENQEGRQSELISLLKRTTTTLQNNGYLGRDNDKKIIWSLGKEDRSVSAPKPDTPPPLPDDIQKSFGMDPADPPF